MVLLGLGQEVGAGDVGDLIGRPGEGVETKDGKEGDLAGEEE